MQASEQTDALWQAVCALPKAQRIAVVLYYREGLTIEEVAEMTEVSPGTVKTHLFRARAQIRDELAGKGFGGDNVR